MTPSHRRPPATAGWPRGRRPAPVPCCPARAPRRRGTPSDRLTPAVSPIDSASRIARPYVSMASSNWPRSASASARLFQAALAPPRVADSFGQLPALRQPLDRVDLRVAPECDERPHDADVRPGSAGEREGLLGVWDLIGDVAEGGAQVHERHQHVGPGPGRHLAHRERPPQACDGLAEDPRLDAVRREGCREAPGKIRVAPLCGPFERHDDVQVREARRCVRVVEGPRPQVVGGRGRPRCVPGTVARLRVDQRTRGPEPRRGRSPGRSRGARTGARRPRRRTRGPVTPPRGCAGRPGRRSPHRIPRRRQHRRTGPRTRRAGRRPRDRRRSSARASP